MKKNVVKINENTLRKIVAESVKKVLNEMDGISSPVQTKTEWQQAFEEGVRLGKQFIESQGTSNARMAYKKNRQEFWNLENRIYKKYELDAVSRFACLEGLRFSMGMGNVDTRKYQGFHGRDYTNLGGAYGADSPIM